MIQIKTKENNSNSSIGAVIRNADDLAIEVRIRWDFTTSAPVTMKTTSVYKSPTGGVTIVDERKYEAGGTFTPAEEKDYSVFDETYNAGLLALVRKCFMHYNDVTLITE